IYFAVEIQVIFIFQLRRRLDPSRTCIVDDIVNFYSLVLRLAIFVLSVWFRGSTGTKTNRDRQEFSILHQNLLKSAFVQELFRICIDMQDDVGSPLSPRSLSNFKTSRSVARPAYRNSALLIRKRLYFNQISNHKSRIKAQSKPTDYLIGIFGFFEFLDKFGSTRKRDLIDILLYLLRCHPDPLI